MYVRTLGLMAILAGTLVGCSMVRGPVGPEGPQGADGPQGSPGEAGIDGQDGEDGDAGILYSDWFTPGTWASDAPFGLTVFSHEVSVPEIETDIVDHGVVLVYGRFGSYAKSFWDPNEVGQLPISLHYRAAGITYEDTFRYVVGEGTLTLEFLNDQNLYTDMPKGNEFRYVIVPGGTALSAAEWGRLVDMPYDEMLDWLEGPEHEPVIVP